MILRQYLHIEPVVAASFLLGCGGKGSACHAHDVRLAPVLRAMGVEPEWGMGTLRLSVGRYTSQADVDDAVRIIAGAVRSQATTAVTAG
jgi:cysteine sulfinate desulfinase/cysteine desulfurase-like protein